jgi:hypothetical protein
MVVGPHQLQILVLLLFTANLEELHPRPVLMDLRQVGVVVQGVVVLGQMKLKEVVLSKVERGEAVVVE